MAVLIQRVTGTWPRLIRPPYGAVNRQLLEMFQQRGWTTVMWSSASVALSLYACAAPPGERSPLGTLLTLVVSVQAAASTGRLTPWTPR